MTKTPARPRSPLAVLRTSLIASIAAIALLFVVTAGALADTVNITDNAGVLNQSQVRSAASNLPYPVDIYTISNFNGSDSSFDRTVRSKIDRNNKIVIAINPAGRHVAIAGGKDVNLGTSDYSRARTAFTDTMKQNSSNYTGATVNALNSLNNSISSRGGNNSSPIPGFSSGGGGFPWTTCCCTVLLILGAVAVFGAFFNRRRTGSWNNFSGWGRRQNVPPYDPNQPYNQYNQPYGPGYPQQNQGMNPWAAGGLGAAAGGLIGYELGKNQGENQGGNQGGGGASGNWDSGNSGDGGGASGNWDSGNSGGSGGGSDWGGGSSGGWGGDSGGGGWGGDSGGGGGGGDSGGW